MRALFFDGKSVKYKSFHPDPLPGPDEALIEIKAAGVCQTDLEIAKGYMNFKGILGHEFVGVVRRVSGKAGHELHGKRVAGEINCVCRECDMCARGLSAHCRNRDVIGIQNRDGCFADLLTLPVHNLHAIPDNVSDEQAVFVEPLAAAIQVLRQVQIDNRTKVAVLGDGRLGQLVAQVVKTLCPGVLLIGRHPAKLAIAERVGIQTKLDADVHPRRDQDVVIDCTGRAEGLERAIALVRPRGTLVMKTTVAAGKPLNLSPVVVDEITLLGSRCGPFRDAIAMLATRQVDVSGLVSRRMKLADAEGVFAGNLPAEVVKIVLTFEK